MPLRRSKQSTITLTAATTPTPELIKALNKNIYSWQLPTYIQQQQLTSARENDGKHQQLTTTTNKTKRRTNNNRYITAAKNNSLKENYLKQQ
jgi:hypothetical protein